jgi:hypothetical protein
MDEKLLPNPDAFPNTCGATGMSLRDWFAGESIAAAYRTLELDYARVPLEFEIAAQAYRIADAMLARRVKLLKTEK